MHTTRPSRATRRAGSPSSPSQLEAAWRRTSVAVAAMFASVQLAAATLTVRQVAATGLPVAGSMMWCIVAPRWRQRRTAVLDVARPPETIETVCPGADTSLRWSSVTCTRQPSGGQAPDVAMSPPTLTSVPQPAARDAAAAARSAAHAFAVAPRSSDTPDGTRTQPLARSTVTACHDGRTRATTFGGWGACSTSSGLGSRRQSRS